jgi:hypothetical protein
MPEMRAETHVDLHVKYPLIVPVFTKFICLCISVECEPGSSVSIVSGYGLDDRAIEDQSPEEAKGFFL